MVDDYPESIMQKTFVRVAQNAQVTSQWQYLAKQLGLTRTDIDSIEGKCTGMRERCYQVMSKGVAMITYHVRDQAPHTHSNK